MKCPEKCKYEHRKTKMCCYWNGTCNFMDEPENTEICMVFPIEVSSRKELPDNNIISQEQWDEYVRDVMTGKYECCEYLEIPIRYVKDWVNNNDDTIWGNEEPVFDIKYQKIKNPLYTALE